MTDTPGVQRRSFPVPAALTKAAQAAGSGAEPAAPRPAATVMLVRDAPPDAIEVFMLRRAATMAFAARMVVFPGGGVDARDSDRDLPWVGPSPLQWAQSLAADSEDLARELVVAAAREVFEECGVLLAGPDESQVVAHPSGAEWEAERQALLAREQSFTELLLRRDLVLRTDLMRAWAHWITPEFEPRRYDTRFFVAVLPEGQTPHGDTSEADDAGWWRPGGLLQDAEAGSAMLMPPTRVCLEQLSAVSAAAAVFDHAPAMRRVMPVLADGPDGPVLTCEIPQ